MPLNPTIQRLITKAYHNDFGNLHAFDETKMRAYLSPPKIKLQATEYTDYKTDHNIDIRCYSPSYTTLQAIDTPQKLPVVIFISATAFVLDRLGASNDYCSLIANTLKMKVINIQHRLAPEYKFPVFLDDCIDSILWIANHADALNIDAEQIFIWGESSGATIAISCTHELRDRSIALIKHQTLFYPMVDRVNDYPSKTEFGSGYMLDQTFIDWLDERGFHPEQDRAHPRISPVLAQDFSQLPPATVITAHYDPLRDEGELYAKKLQQAQTPVFHYRFPDMIHGFMRFYGKIPAAETAFQLACAQIKKHTSSSQDQYKQHSDL